MRAFYDLQSLDTKQSCLCKDILKQKATKKQTHHTRKIVHPPRNPYVINLNLNTKCLSSVLDIIQFIFEGLKTLTSHVYLLTVNQTGLSEL